MRGGRDCGCGTDRVVLGLRLGLGSGLGLG